MIYMREKKEKKVKKTVYLATWLVDMLDYEGERCNGPGEVVGAAVLGFILASDAVKTEMLVRLREFEARDEYKLRDIKELIEETRKRYEAENDHHKI